MIGRGLVAAVALAVAGTGCVVQASSASPPDQEYLSSVRQLDSSLNSWTDSDLVGVGHAVCYGFDHGLSAQQVVDALAAAAQRSGVTASQAVAILQAAINSRRCPAHGKYGPVRGPDARRPAAGQAQAPPGGRRGPQGP